MNSFYIPVKYIKGMITYFKGVNKKSKKNYENYKLFSTILKTDESFAIIASTSSSIPLSLVGLGLILKPSSASIACGLSLSSKILHEIILHNYNKYKKQYQKDEQTIKCFD